MTLFALAPQLAAMLRELALGTGEYMQCPICDRMQPNGVHAADCRLHALLKDLP